LILDFRTFGLIEQAVSMSIIIIGAGEVGYHLAQRLSQEKKDVVVIDRDGEKIKRVQNTLDVRAIHGSGGSLSILREAGMSEASMVIAVTNSDEVNMISCLVAGVQDKVPKKIARVRDPEYSALFPLFDKEHLDIDLVINPDHEVVDLILKLMEVPGAVDVADFAGGKVRMAGLPLLSNSPLAGKSLADISALYPNSGILIVAVQKGERVFIPKGPDVIRANDRLFMVMARDKMQEALESSGHKRPPIKRVMILGGGLIGMELAENLEKKRDIQVKIIEQNEDRCRQIAEKCDRALVLRGDATYQDLLIEENVAQMDTFIAVTEDEETNVMISLLAKKMGVRRVITLVNKVGYSPLVHSIGVDVVVSPRLAAVNRIMQFLRRGKILSISSLPEENAEAFEAVAMETSDIVGRPLREMEFPKEAIVGAIVRGPEVIIPNGSTVIQPGDRVMIFALTSAVKEVEKALMVKLEYW
jgi:trk system potassium uptake protein TrkA